MSTRPGNGPALSSNHEPPLGLIAGNGVLPLLFIKKIVTESSRTVVVAAHRGETDPRVQDQVSDLLWVTLGQFKKIIRFFKDRGVRELVLAGGISKTAIWKVRPDTMALKLVWRLKHLHDDHLLRAIAVELERCGLQVRSVTDYLPQLLAPVGVLSRKVPDEAVWEDIRIGWRAAKVLGGLDIGQGVVVKKKVVVAVEAMEGTDAMLRRAGELVAGARNSWAGRGAVVLVKTCKPGQDLRLDLPTVGPGTITGMQTAGVSVLAIEGGRTLLLDPEQTLAMVDQNGQIFVSCDEAMMTPETGGTV
ncbi:MAG: UDP-2,3-diacylglucosamine diphosphatase LpxI [Magnetococcales bacterium]|nr:UDP-2,3-diacylglucosamine diphosphatase LpxI [Magnetococcales bacterium]